MKKILKKFITTILKEYDSIKYGIQEELDIEKLYTKKIEKDNDALREENKKLRQRNEYLTNDMNKHAGQIVVVHGLVADSYLKELLLDENEKIDFVKADKIFGKLVEIKHPKAE